MSEKVYGCVMYTDGGCRPSRGIGGWGLHGYLYEQSEGKVGSGLKTHSLTDQGYIEKAKKDSVNAITYYDGTGSIIPETTNNVAELTGFVRALHLIIELSELEETPIERARVFSDSKYVIQGTNVWLDDWKENEWKKKDGEEVSNRSLWEEVARLIEKIQSRDIDVEFGWVKGHDGFLGNELAHNNAELGVIAGRKGIQTDDLKTKSARGYWNPKVEINRILSHSRWYFNTGPSDTHSTEDGRTIYYLGDHGDDDDFLGKRMSDAAFSVVYLKKADPVLESIRREQKTLDPNQFDSIAVGRLDWIFRPKIYKEVEENGSTYLHQKSTQRDLYSPAGFQLTRELNPPRLAFNLVEVVNVLETILNEFIRGEEANSYTYTDITDEFYEGEKVKERKLKSHVSDSSKSLVVPARYQNSGTVETADVTLTVGMDVPRRNVLSAIAKRNARIHLVTWKASQHAFRYATIIEVGDDIGIWAGFYANLHLLT